MKISYDAETDSLYVELKSDPGVETIEVASGLDVDVDARGEVVGFDIDHAAARFELTEVTGFDDAVKPKRTAFRAG